MNKRILCLIFIVIFWNSAGATDDCRGNSCNGGGDIDIGGTNVDVGGTNVDVGTDVTTDVTVGDTNVNVPITTGPTNVTGGDTTLNNESRALALSNSLGDVDIAGCLGSQQFNTPIFGRQNLVLNKVCMADFYLKTQKYALAAQQLCNIKEILEEFENEAECEAAHDFAPVVVEEPVIVMSESNDEEVEYLRDELQRQEAFPDELENKVQSLEQQQRVVIREPYLSDEKKDKLREIVK
jgi:hypothetical protein